MKKFTGTTVRVTAVVYEQLQQMWRVGYDQELLDYIERIAPKPYQLARQLGLASIYSSDPASGFT